MDLQHKPLFKVVVQSARGKGGGFKSCFLPVGRHVLEQKTSSLEFARSRVGGALHGSGRHWWVNERFVNCTKECSPFTNEKLFLI